MRKRPAMGRSITQITSAIIDGDATLFAVAADGTLWRGTLEREQEDILWQPLNPPPEGVPGRRDLTLEEIAERLRKAGGRKMIVKGPSK